MAVSGLLVVIALVGQHEIQAKARFNTAVDQEVQNMNYTRNFALSGVNLGPGNSTAGVIAGTALELDNDHLPNNPLAELETLYANSDSDGNVDLSTISNIWPVGQLTSTCPPAWHPSDSECYEEFFNVGDTLSVKYAGNTDGSVVNSAPDHAVIYYAKTKNGLHICEDLHSPGYMSVSGACFYNTVSSPVDIILIDPSGFKSTIEVDNKTGFTKRLN
jgi:hypothetical protein